MMEYYEKKKYSRAVWYLVDAEKKADFIAILNAVQRKNNIFCNIESRPYHGKKYSSVIWICVG